MALTKKQQELAEALKDAETLPNLRAVVDTMKPEDKQALRIDIHAATERIVRLVKGF